MDRGDKEPGGEEWTRRGWTSCQRSLDVKEGYKITGKEMWAVRKISTFKIRETRE